MKKNADREFPSHLLPVQLRRESRSSAAACNLMKIVLTNEERDVVRELKKKKEKKKD